MIQGQCLCGAVTFQIDLSDNHVGETRFCYCTECRRANGTVFSANVAVPREHYTLLTGADVIKEFESSPGNFRAFCTECGSPVYAKKGSQSDHIRLRLGTLDHHAKAIPAAHVWVSEKPDWYEIVGDLKRFEY